MERLSLVLIMKAKEFKKIMKTDTRKHIIFLHTTGQIYLTSKQLDIVLERK